MMRRRIVRILCGALAFAGLALLPSGAAGHWVDVDTNEWYFRGATYDKDDLTKRVDPINFIFLGGTTDFSDYTRDRIETHMRDDWSIRAVGGRRWRRDDQIEFWCKDDQRMIWLGYPGQTSDKTDFHGSTSRLESICGDQHHARFWDDLEHSRIAPDGHPRRHQWVVGGIHHERLRSAFGGHDIDRDWDQVRYEMVRAMRRHCAERTWRYHPGADGDFGDEGYDSFGFIARISLHHVADGGCTGH
jgi:hypothetical protein